MSSTLEEIIQKLLVADNDVIKEGTHELSEALKSATVIGDLCHVMGTAETPDVRQYASVILRQRLKKSRNWSKLPNEMKSGIKDGVLTILLRETDSSVKNAIAQFVGVVAKHEFEEGKWPNLLNFIQHSVQSQNLQERDLGIYVISVVSGVAGDQLMPHFHDFLHLFSNILSDPASSHAYHVIQSLTNFAPFVGQEHLRDFQNVLPKVIESMKAMTKVNEDHTAEAVELFEVLAKCEVAILVPHLKTAIQFCLVISTDENLGEALRTRAITFVGFITRLKKKFIVKNKLVSPIVTAMFAVVCSEEDDDGGLGFLSGEDQGDGSNPVHAAAQTLDVCALHLPPEKLLAILMALVDPALVSNEPCRVKGAYIALAMIAEGCSDTLRLKHLYPLLQCVCRGITSEQQLIRNSALFTSGQFAEHLQPDVSKFHAELLPVLLHFLTETCIFVTGGHGDPTGVDRMFYALEVFCENLEEDLLPYLPMLMERLYALLCAQSSVHMKELAISTIGAIATAAKGHMSPYFQDIVKLLKGYLTEDQSDETLTLQVQSLDTLSQLARCMGSENFTIYAADCVVLGLSLLEKKEDPDLRKTCYLLFASVSSVMKENLAPYLPVILERMIGSLRSSDGMVTLSKDGETIIPATIEGLSESETDNEEEVDLEPTELEDSDEEEVAAYSVENAFVEEKEDTCVAFREMALHCGEAFVPYLKNCTNDVYKMLNYPSADVRQAAVGAMSQFVMTLAKVKGAVSDFDRLIRIVIPKFSELIRVDEERNVVMACLEGFADILKDVGARVLEPEGHLDAIVNCVRAVMTKQTICQDVDDDAGNEDEEEAEQDEMMIEYAGEVLPSLGKAMPQEQFAELFAQLLSLFVNKLKPSNSAAERSFSIGTIAETVGVLGNASAAFVAQLLPLFLQGIKDEEDDVRSNSIYGLGLLAENGGNAVIGQFSAILTLLSDVLSKEKFPRAIDNILGSVARLLITSPSTIPVAQVFPVLLKYMPLREDFAENSTVFKCFLVLYSAQHPTIVQNLDAMLQLCSNVYLSKDADEETNGMISEFVSKCYGDFPSQVNAVMQTMEPVLAKKLCSIVGVSIS